MKVFLVLSAVLATALCAPTQREALSQSQQQQQQQQQQLRQVLTHLLSSSSNVQDMPADMQGFWSNLMGHAIKLAHRHVLPHLERGGGGEEGEEPGEGGQAFARQQQGDEDYARFEQMEEEEGGDYAAQLQQFGEDYALEQVLAALQQWEGLNDEAKAQFDFGRMLGSLGSLFGSGGQNAKAQFNFGRMVGGLSRMFG